MVGHRRDTQRLGTAGLLCGWALQGLKGYSAVGHCRFSLWLGTARDTPLQYCVVGHCRDTWWLGTVGIPCGWALQGSGIRYH